MLNSLGKAGYSGWSQLVASSSTEDWGGSKADWFFLQAAANSSPPFLVTHAVASAVKSLGKFPQTESLALPARSHFLPSPNRLTPWDDVQSIKAGLLVSTDTVAESAIASLESLPRHYGYYDFRQSPTSESDSSPSNQGFNKEVGHLNCLVKHLLISPVAIPFVLGQEFFDQHRET